MAADLGKTLLAEVEEASLGEILQQLRLDEEGFKPYYALAAIDILVQAAVEARTNIHATTTSTPPVIELTSSVPAAGKTHLLYHSTALAVLPADHGGRQACVVIIDTDDNFSVQRLTQQLRLVLSQVANENGAEPVSALSAVDVDKVIAIALKHVHIFRPQSFSSTVATLQTLPTYLFNTSTHFSIDRELSFIALDSASTFYWQDRFESENAALLTSTTSTVSTHAPPSKPESGYTHITSALRSACATLHCPAIVTTHHLVGPIPAPAPPQGGGGVIRSLRPSLPAPFSQLPALRLIVQRLPVRKFPPGISVEEAMREASDRHKAVAEGKFEAVVNEWGMDERVLRQLQQAGGGFAFRIYDDGLMVDDKR